MDWEQIKKEYIDSEGTILLKDLATKYGVKDSTVRSRKNREKWDSFIENGVATQKRNVAKISQQKQGNNIVKLSEEIIEHLEETKLTDKQKLFCIYYVKYFNATKAALKAGYSKDTARSIASENLAKPYICNEIKRLKADRFKGAFLEPEDLLQKYIDIAFADITDYLDFGKKDIELNGEGDEDSKTIEVNYVDFKDSSTIDGTIISEVKQGKDGVSIKLQDKMKALEFLAKHIGLLSIEQQEKLKNEEEKLELARRKVEIIEKQNDDLDEDISYEVIESEED
ncbi:hypothetical protein FDF74_11530 [Clostridium niameyense]|uniref:PBSX phage terminase small subunit-like N-terminal domain-containing protein n=1 Tax=Clostridium niameyense TaxID=1622073 RepID=A0A6M0RCB1_9CLOT|nr:hypothetical protein [Clostridium niameyense]